MSDAAATSHEPEERYDGPAHVRVDGHRLGVAVRLRGRFEPIDGLFHWWGRLDRSDDLDGLVRSGATVGLETPHGAADGRLSDVDPWGRFRIAGTGRPPF
ncbi:MAG TPA: DUF4873 domain-containing protein [Nocardioidaceae bacterium]|nr:DUF4873 domain-containing protein [Nocardioidaceae bacterium]